MPLSALNPSLANSETPIIEDPVSARGLKILVADDSHSIRSVIELILEDMGHQVISAEDGRQAVELFQREARSWLSWISLCR